jgi:hypothetical protein
MTSAKNRRKFLLGSAAGITGAALAAQSTSASEHAKSAGSKPAWDQIARIQPDRTSGFAHSGWPLDADPTLPQLKAGSQLTVANLAGPAVITLFHVTQLRYAATLPDSPEAVAAMRDASVENARLRREAVAEGLTPPAPLITPELVPDDIKARGVILEVYWDGVDSPSDSHGVFPSCTTDIFMESISSRRKARRWSASTVSTAISRFALMKVWNYVSIILMNGLSRTSC